jgi:hypothetical protein
MGFPGHVFGKIFFFGAAEGVASLQKAETSLRQSAEQWNFGNIN